MSSFDVNTLDKLDAEAGTAGYDSERQASQLVPPAQTDPSKQGHAGNHNTLRYSVRSVSENASSPHSLKDDLLISKVTNTEPVQKSLQIFSSPAGETKDTNNATNQAGQKHESGNKFESDQSYVNKISVANQTTKTTETQQQTEPLQDAATPSSPSVISSPQLPVSQPTLRDQSVQQYYGSANVLAVSAQPLVIANRIDGNQNAENSVPVAYPVEEGNELYQVRRIRRFVLLTVYLAFMGLVLYFVLTKIKNEGQEQETTLLFNLTQNDPRGQLIVSIMGADAAVLNNESSPYTQALIWLLQSDERNESQQMQDTTAQRFFAAAFYFSTTTAVHKWTACNPPSTSSELDQICTPPNDDDEILYREVWLSDSHECTWSGVRCDNHSQIIGLNLLSMNLVGGFPIIATRFPFLGWLKLRNSQLNGEIPSLSDFQHLFILELENNTLSGDLSSTSIWQNRKLVKFFAAYNNLTGSLSSRVSNCVDLKWLDLSSNQLTGTIPNEVGWLDSLFWIDISTNAFQGTLPQSMQLWSMVTLLYVADNNFSGSIPTFIGQLNATLTSLDFSYNRFKGSLPDEIYYLNHLQVLEVIDNELSGTLDTRLAQFPDLVGFALSENNFSGTIPTEIGLLTNLTVIDLADNDFTGSVPASICANQRKAKFVLTADCGKDENGKVEEIQCDCCTLCVSG